MLLCAAGGSGVFSAEEKLFFTAPSELPNVSRHMHTAGFWIKRHPAPDKVIMTPPQIEAFNNHIRNDLKLTKDIFAVTRNFQTETLVADFEKILNDFTDKGHCTAAGTRNDTAFIDKARRNMNLPDVISGMAPRYGLVVQYTDVRFLPTAEGLYESPGDFDFDQLQNSSLDVGTAVAVVHQSADKKWYYVLTALSDGWVRKEDIALAQVKTVRDFVENPQFVVATVPKAEIFLNEAMTDYLEYVRMGTRLPLVSLSQGKVQVFVPIRDKDGKLQTVPSYVSSASVHEGFLSLTPRTIYNQAFAMLNQPYGWGGMYGQQDRSAFLDEVFGTVGIILPRDSKNQAQVGTLLAEFNEKTAVKEKLESLSAVPPAEALLWMKGHILLYLGMVDERPYAIHAVWAFRQRQGDRDVPRVLNRVVVSDLSLGEGSQKGSLLKRLIKIIEIK